MSRVSTGCRRARDGEDPFDEEAIAGLVAQRLEVRARGALEALVVTALRGLADLERQGAVSTFGSDARWARDVEESG